MRDFNIQGVKFGFEKDEVLGPVDIKGREYSRDLLPF